MWILHFFRFYISAGVGIVASILLIPTWWFGVICTIAVRAGIGITELFIEKNTTERLFKAHAASFKQELGPYGIRMVNRAEKDAHLRKNLTEVFVKDEKKLRKAVEQLEMMETLFKAGMQPDADTWQIHDLKLKYGKYRLSQLEKSREKR